MNPETVGTPKIEEERRQQLEELAADKEPGWIDQYQPGSFGCHELLDRTSLLEDSLERDILSHPSCLGNPEWYALAHRAVTALIELYQSIGAAHLGAEGPPGIWDDEGH